MTRKEASKALANPMFKAFAEGKQLQLRSPEGPWFDSHGSIAIHYFAWNDCVRIKPDEKAEYKACPHCGK